MPAVSEGCGPLKLECNGQLLAELISFCGGEELRQTKSLSAWFYLYLCSTPAVAGVDPLGILLIVAGGFECLFSQEQ